MTWIGPAKDVAENVTEPRKKAENFTEMLLSLISI